MNPYFTASAAVAAQPHTFTPSSPNGLQLASSPPQQQQQSVPSQLSLLQRQQLLQQQQQQQRNQQQGQLRLDQFQQEQQRQQHMASMGTNVVFNNTNNSDSLQQQQQQQQQQRQQQQQQQQLPFNPYQATKQNWDILTGPNAINNPMALQIGPDGSLMAPRWDAYDLSNLPPVQIAPRAKNINVIPRTTVNYAAQQNPSVLLQRQPYLQQQQQQQQHHNPLSLGAQEAVQQQMVANSHYLFNASSPVATISTSEIGVMASQQLTQQQQQLPSSSPAAISGYLQTSSSPEMPIKTSPVEPQLSWPSWEEASQQDDSYATPAHTHTSFDDSPSEDAEYSAVKHLKVFTSSKKDDDGEFRKGQQFYLNIQLAPEDAERYRYLRIPTESIVLPCRADSAGRIGLNASGKRSAESMSMPMSAQEEDVLALRLTTFLEPEHRVVVPCGRCKDKTPEILRFHPGVNGKPMIDENGMVSLRGGHVKLIASAWCASTSHHRGPGTKFSFQVELSGMTCHQVEPVLVYEGRSDEVEIYASHGRDKGTRIANKSLEKTSESHSPPLQERDHSGPPSPAKTTASSPPSSPSTAATHYESGPAKKRREDAPLTPPIIDSDLPPTIKSLEPRKGPICRENHVIIIGANFSQGMTPMFGREYATVVDINPFYIECTTPRYPNTETVRIWIYHKETYLSTDKTYEFTDEQAQSDMEQLLRNLIQDGEGGDAGSYLTLLERIAGLPPSTDISGQVQSNGSTMLHNSVLLGYSMGVNLLIEEGIELDLEDDSGFTALDYAIFNNKVQITEALLQAGSMLSYERLDALRPKPSEEMLELLRNMCNLELPVHPAASSPEVEALAPRELYIEASAGALIHETILEDAEAESASESPDFNQSMSQLQFPSSAPVFERSRAISSKARPLSISTVSTQSTGMMSLAPTMSTMALSSTSSTQSRISIPFAPRQTPGVKGGLETIWLCAKKGNLALVKYHLEKEPSLINAPWKFDGRSVLSSACASSQPLDLVEYLVQRGALVNSADTFHKRTALHTLCEEGGLSQDDWRVVTPQAEQDANERDVLATMRFLLDHGAVVDAKNHWKETPLMRLFAGRDCPLMVQELYSRGTDSRLKSSRDAYPHGTALCYAAFYGCTKSLKWMIENDLLLNDEANIKDAIRWASKSESVLGSSLASVKQSANTTKKKEERKAEAIRLLEGWLGESGQAKRKALAMDVAEKSSDDWWCRMSGIVKEKTGEFSSASSSSNLPVEMVPLWKEVHGLSQSLSQDLVSSSGSRNKWNPLTMLRK